jgi:hypothetical protein
MNSRLIVASAAGLFVIAGFAHSQGMPDTPQPAPQENAATQNAALGTGTQAYGGMPDTKIQGGVKHARPCGTDPQCNIFFGGARYKLMAPGTTTENTGRPRRAE